MKQQERFFTQGKQKFHKKRAQVDVDKNCVGQDFVQEVEHRPSTAFTIGTVQLKPLQSPKKLQSQLITLTH